MRFLSLFLWVLVLGVSGCALFGAGDEAVVSSPPPPLMPLSAEPEVSVSLVGETDLSANILIGFDRPLEEDVWVYLHIFTEGGDGDLLKALVPAGSQGRNMSFPRELFFWTPVFVQVFPCQDECYKPVGEPIPLFN